jgi:hypothetical protein
LKLNVNQLQLPAPSGPFVATWMVLSIELHFIKMQLSVGRAYAYSWVVRIRTQTEQGR